MKKERLLTCIYAKLLWMLINWNIITETSNQLFELKKEKLSGFKSSRTLLNNMEKLINAIKEGKKVLTNLLSEIIKILIKNNKCEKRYGKNSSQLMI